MIEVILVEWEIKRGFALASRGLGVGEVYYESLGIRADSA